MNIYTELYVPDEDDEIDDPVSIFDDVYLMKMICGTETDYVIRPGFCV